MLRRLLATVFMVAAGWSAGWQPAAQPGSQVVALTRDLSLGSPLTSGDLDLVWLTDPPDGSLVRLDQAIGQQLSGAARRGEVLTDRRLADPNGPDPGPGRVAIAVRPADPALVPLLRPGMSVTVVGLGSTGTATTLSADALVLQVLGDTGEVADRSPPILVSVAVEDADRVTAGTFSGEVALVFT